MYVSDAHPNSQTSQAIHSSDSFEMMEGVSYQQSILFPLTRSIFTFQPISGIGACLKLANEVVMITVESFK